MVLHEIIAKIYKYSIKNDYLPKLWREIKVTFIPKPGKKSYNTVRFSPKRTREIDTEAPIKDKFNSTSSQL
jgi:hypothetical protein